jgi:hypothetical protein
VTDHLHQLGLEFGNCFLVEGFRLGGGLIHGLPSLVVRIGDFQR